MTDAVRDIVRLVVELSLPDTRLDAFLRERLADVSRGAIQRLIESGHIRVNGRHAKATQSPKAGDCIEVQWPEPTPAEARPQAMALEVLMEDEDVIVLNKPPGLVVHPSAGHEDGTVVNALLHHCGGQLSGIGGVARPGIVHRLDKDTSGCLVAAKNDRAHLALADQFAGRDVRKVYQAIVCGTVRKAAGEIRAGIARHPNHRKRMAVAEGGREAWTSYQVGERLRESSLVLATLHTGRTHQIRVHFHHLGHPVVGDATYGLRQNTQFGELTGYHAPRQLLHAWQLEFRHPTQDRTISVEAPLPADFVGALETLRLRRD